ncbi:hypothetical protein D5086_031578 [Populus alba]|uniref:Uncharacterized protein n=1 Tax=Populus alba TaxID=43335 RepID=A0ACC4AJV8_POPAL
MGRQENTKVVNSCFDLRQETLSSILSEIEGHTITSQLLEMWPDGQWTVPANYCNGFIEVIYLDNGTTQRKEKTLMEETEGG